MAKKKTEINLPEMKIVADTANEEAQDAEKALSFINKMSITNQADLKFAVGVVAEVKERANAVEEKKKTFTDPLKQVIKDLDAFFKPALDSLKMAEANLKEHIASFHERAEETRRNLILEAGKNPEKAAALIKEADTHIIEKIDGLSVRSNIAIAISDAGGAVQWCAQNGRWDLLQLNEKAIKAIAKEGATLPPGVVAVPNSTIAITVDKVQR